MTRIDGTTGTPADAELASLRAEVAELRAIVVQLAVGHLEDAVSIARVNRAVTEGRPPEQRGLLFGAARPLDNSAVLARARELVDQLVPDAVEHGDARSDV